jgi:hypothetical protein
MKWKGKEGEGIQKEERKNKTKVEGKNSERKFTND